MYAIRSIFLLLAVNVLACVAASSARADDRPNIVIFLADDLGWGDLGCYGNKVIQTPNLDAFAKQGLRLSQCYAACAVCSPSRSAIQTGRTPYRNGVFNWIPEGSEVHLRTSEITLATLLKRAGYATCHVGKWHLNGKFNSPDQPQPSAHGYDWWLATQNNAAPSHKNPNNFVRNGEKVGPLEGFSAVLVVDEAIRWLKEHRDPKQPFFLTVWTHEPHLPIESDPQFQKLYPDALATDPDLAQHHGNVTQLDYAFGRLMKALDEQKVTDNTLVAFTSDNGPEGDGLKGRTRGSTGGLRGRKRAVYEGGIRVPGIIRWPGRVMAATESATPVVGSDLFPTVLQIAGVPLPTDRKIDGTTLVPLFANQPIDRKVPLYFRCAIAPGQFKIALRDGDWKILASEKLSDFELYNLAADPHETTDLAAKVPEKLAALKETLTKLNAEIEAEGPDWWRSFKQPMPKAKAKGKKAE